MNPIFPLNEYILGSDSLDVESIQFRLFREDKDIAASDMVISDE
ncbi:hypothetical protein [Vallitalea pronyensis]|nr:hypothetical protein [Vallitalea pronyensis]